MDSSIIFIIFFNLLFLGGLTWLILKKMQALNPPSDPKAMVNEVFGAVASQLNEQSRQVLSGEREIILKDMSAKQQELDKAFGELRRELKERQQELHGLETQREKQFGSLQTLLREHQEVTKDLNAKTDKLTRILSSNQQRGQWGEYILDDILRRGGLISGTHFLKQAPLPGSTDRPDITLLLPENRYVPVDAKFPYAAIIEMLAAENPAGRDLAKKKFISDVKTKVNQVAKYINPEAGTLDFALLFVPNESLFSYINDVAPEVTEDAMNKRVMIVSPFTFLAVARIVIESYRNFLMEKHLQKIVKYIAQFIEEWSRFEKEFDVFGGSIGKLQSAFDQIAKTRYKQMQLRIRRVEEVQSGTKELETGL